VKGVVTNGLHDTGPVRFGIGPARVGVELAILFDEGFCQDFDVGWFGRSPHLRQVDAHQLVARQELFAIPLFNQSRGHFRSGNIRGKIMLLKHTTLLEPFDDTRVSFSWPAGVSTLGHPTKRPAGKGFVEILAFEFGLVANVVS